jgi:predicted small lipoprotein YifL
MRGCFVAMLILVLLYGPAGCGTKGPKLLKAKGKVVKGGEDFTPDTAEGEGLQVCFIPIAADSSPPKNWYAAQVDQSTGYFVASGGEGKGMPKGKYRVMVELKKNRKDLLGGKFDALNSPYEFEVDENSELMVVDIAKTQK